MAGYKMEIILFALGLSVGSFLNVVIDRLPISKSIVKGRSNCDFCRHKLAWFDLIPVISFVSLKRKCRYCGKKISWQYPLVELTAGLLFLFAGNYNSMLIILLLNLMIVSGLVAIFVTDLKYRIIPDSVLIFLITVAFIFQLITKSSYIFSNMVIGLVTGLFFLMLVLITKGRGMGLGDVKYSFFMGFFLGFPKIIVAFYLSFLTGAIVSLILIMTARKKMKSTIAFGPFLVVATFVSYFYGDQLWMIFSKILGI